MWNKIELQIQEQQQQQQNSSMTNKNGVLLNDHPTTNNNKEINMKRKYCECYAIYSGRYITGLLDID